MRKSLTRPLINSLWPTSAVCIREGLTRDSRLVAQQPRFLATRAQRPLTRSITLRPPNTLPNASHSDPHAVVARTHSYSECLLWYYLEVSNANTLILRLKNVHCRPYTRENKARSPRFTGPVPFSNNVVYFTLSRLNPTQYQQSPSLAFTIYPITIRNASSAGYKITFNPCIEDGIPLTIIYL